MKIEINSKYKKLVKVLLVVFPLLSIATAFLSLPLVLSLPIAILITTIPLILDRFVFNYKVLHIMPMPTNDMLVHRLGTSWVADNIETMEGLGIVILFKYKHVAKDAYGMLKAWNYGKVIDPSENISFNVVREQGSTYSAFLYAGDRLDSIIASEALAKERHGSNAKIAMSVAKFYMQFSFDYSESELKTKCVESLPYVDELHLNVGYARDGEIVMYSKRGFRLKKFSLRDRVDVPDGTIESLNEWISPEGKLSPINQALVEQVNRNLESNT
ncbi:hypothetical protein ACXIU6_22570 [Vibrio parahaemolyticus]|uniref:hypothetical protein n=1 Tax=Vibrio vulnificus TaxID=672 RepID=UPI0019D41521|nr:hypothetical protein [Vibrio vulnificus]MBE4205817.1 hypothetical protein [Vibrio parahaemolyticus]MBN8090837.1 hypothetical protein [Vibrio vulnificus]MBN8119548.1 hypothetical protein [Vibrio vulnificus]HDY7832382.1 hypothetical protein [Vibrio vulnificus]